MPTMRPNNHPHRAGLPYKVYGSAPKPVAAFAHQTDAEGFARRESMGCSITYRVKLGSVPVQMYFRGEEVPNG